MRRSGYDSYHGKSPGRTALKVIIVVLLLLLGAALAALFVLEPYIKYSADGVRVDLPFFEDKEEQPFPEVSLTVTTPEPEETVPVAERFQGIMLPKEALYDGTAASQMEAAGALAAIFDMKDDQGSLAYISALALAQSAEVSSKDPAMNAAIQLLNEKTYTVARISCFRDNTLPQKDRRLAIPSSG